MDELVEPFEGVDELPANIEVIEGGGVEVHARGRVLQVAEDAVTLQRVTLDEDPDPFDVECGDQALTFLQFDAGWWATAGAFRVGLRRRTFDQP
jgi:hypothetical protein